MKRRATEIEHDACNILQDVCPSLQNTPEEISALRDKIKSLSRKDVRAEQVSLESDACRPITMCDKCENCVFIASSEFTINNLPDGFKNPKLVNTVKKLSKCCVKIKISPDNENSTDSIPETTHYGSGWIVGALKTGLASQKYEIGVRTAGHVAFSQSDAKKITVIIECGGEMRGDAASMDTKSMTVDSVIDVSHFFNSDVITLKCFTDDEEIYNMFEDIREDVYEMTDLYHNSENLLVVIVSYPHGLYQTISIGRVENVREHAENRVGSIISKMYEYKACTCSGSSGGPVWVVGRLSSTLGLFHSHKGISQAALKKSCLSYEHATHNRPKETQNVAVFVVSQLVDFVERFVNADAKLMETFRSKRPHNFEQLFGRILEDVFSVMDSKMSDYETVKSMDRIVRQLVEGVTWVNGVGPTSAAKSLLLCLKGQARDTSITKFKEEFSKLSEGEMHCIIYFTECLKKTLNI